MASSLHLIYHSYLSSRGLFNHNDDGDGGSSSSSSDSSSSNHTCSLPNPLTETPTDPITGGYTFHTLGTIISGSAAAFAFLSISLLMFRHATHLSKPNEQLKILRICMLIPVVAVVQFIGQVVPATYFYLTPWADVMQAFALGNFFLLLLEFISPHHTQREFFFSGLQVPQKKKGKAPKDGLTWYRRKWFLIFQYPIVQVIVSIATDVTQGINIYCENSSKPYYSHLWLQLIHNISLITAVVSCLRFYKILKSELYGHKPLSKLFAFKLMVGINFLMGIIFWVLNDLKSSPLTPNSQMNQADMIVGIPAMVNCLVTVPFSIFFHYAYDVGPYIIDRPRRPRRPHGGGGSASRAEAGGAPYLQQYQGGFMGVRAFTGMLNPSEFFGAIAFAFTMFRCCGGRGTTRKGSSIIGAAAAATGGYDNVSSGNREGAAHYEASAGGGGYGHEMSSSRRDQRRVEKSSNGRRGDHGRRYEHRGGGGGGGGENGDQQGYGGYDNRGYR